MSTNRRPRAGVTLVELVVALAIVGISSGVVLLAWRPTDVERHAESRSFAELIADTRRRAAATGRTQNVTFRLATDGLVLEADDVAAGSALHAMAVHPDGSVVASPALRVDRIAGQLLPVPEAAP